LQDLSSASEGEIRKTLKDLTDSEALALMYDWPLWARPNQLPPKTFGTKHNIWMILAGRGWGKTRSGAEAIRQLVYEGYKRIALIGPTPADARDFMVEGDAGILSVFPPDEKPYYEPSKRRITFHTGAVATLYSGYKPDQLRGPSHDAFWADELASWQYLQETWDMLMFGWRLGSPRGVITTTPRPLPLVKELKDRRNAAVTVGSSFENRDNLAPEFFEAIVDRYQGTRLGRQELYAQILDDNPHALWARKDVEGARVDKAPELKRIVVAVDPNASDNKDSDECGIVVAGLGVDEVSYLLEDVSMNGTPQQWGKMAVTMYRKYKADRIVAEINQGGNMVEHVIHTVDPGAAYSGVRASKGKIARAEPIAALYEQGKVKHFGNFPELEDELCEWEHGMPSPNRMDALVWAITELMLDGVQPLKSISKARLGL